MDQCTDEVAGSSPVARAEINRTVIEAVLFIWYYLIMLQLPLYTPQFNAHQFNVSDVLGAWVVIKPEYLWLFSLLVFMFFLVWSFVLSYHWKRFGLETKVMARASILYFSISGGLLATMALFLIVYLNSIK